MKRSYADFVPSLKALSDETRLKVVDMLSCHEMCACDILDGLNISQSTLSYHMKILTDCELVDSKKDGAWTKYNLNTEKFSELKDFIELISSKKENCICESREDCDCSEK